MIFDKFTEPALAVQNALGCSEDIVTVREETSCICRGVGGHVEDVPDVGDGIYACPLEGEAEGCGVGWDWDVDCPGALALFGVLVSSLDRR